MDDIIVDDVDYEECDHHLGPDCYDPDDDPDYDDYPQWAEDEALADDAVTGGQ